MAHSSELRWTGAQASIADASRTTLNALNTAEEVYQELNEVYQYAGGTDQLVADQLFLDIITSEARNPAVANSEEVARVTDLKAAIQALHQLWQTMTNVAVTQADRAALLRRMS